jgi:hypothetical protein
MSDRTKLSDLSRRSREPLLRLQREDLTPLALAGSDSAGRQACAVTGPAITPRGAPADYPLDDTRVLSLPAPASPDEERELVSRFLSGLEKLFSRENNWTFLQPLLLTVEHCARCQTCSDSCHVFEASGGAEIYRPTYRAEILRRLYFQYVKDGGLLSAWQHGTVELKWPAWPSSPTDATCAAAAPRAARSAPTTAWSRTRSGSCSARKWASRRRNCMRRARCCSCGRGPPPA